MKCDFLSVLVVAIRLGFIICSLPDENKSPTPFCDEDWTDGNSVGLGHLWIERFTTCNYEELSGIVVKGTHT